MRRNVVLLKDELHAIGEWLPKSPEPDLRQRNPNAIRTNSILAPRRHATFEQHEVRRGRHQATNQNRDFYKCFNHAITSWLLRPPLIRPHARRHCRPQQQSRESPRRLRPEPCERYRVPAIPIISNTV